MANKSLEELMNVDVTSVSRKEQKLSKTAAAVYVLTREAIARSGSRNIPDLLRMVPGVQVAQLGANQWAISVRGFNNQYSDKLLVLVDGRTVYTPTFSGVYWDQLDIPLDNIEQIEVVRGPGGTIWGANAVNGVINIITKNSSETTRSRVTAGAGSDEKDSFEGRFGGKIGNAGTYRFGADYRDFSSRTAVTGGSGQDGWNVQHFDLRSDLRVSSRDTLMVEGNALQSDGGQLLYGLNVFDRTTRRLPLNNRSYDALARWTRTYSDNADISLQVYVSGYTRHQEGIEERERTIDFDLQNHNRLGSHNDVVWGFGYRFNKDSISNDFGDPGAYQQIGALIQLRPSAKHYDLSSGFFQDELKLTNSLALTLGTKVEHNAFSGFDLSPSVRLAWTPSDRSTYWAATSQASTIPSRLFTAIDVLFPAIPVSSQLGLREQISGNTHFHSQRVRDLEIGYRVAPTTKLTLDTTAFYSTYGELQNAEALPVQLALTSTGALVTLPFRYANGLRGRDYGAELAAMWSVAPSWRLSGSATWLKTNIVGPAISVGPATVESISSSFPAGLSQYILNTLQAASVTGDTTNAPRAQGSLQSYFDLDPKTALDGSVSYVGSIHELKVPAYVRVDAHIRRKLGRGVETSLIGQNLQQSKHLEFSGSQSVSTLAPRSVFGEIAWRF